ncbi:hypothetical protein IGI04_003593, partial [Brassica rapa subsp. trilocularis]
NDSLPLLLGEWLQISSYASLSYATPLSPAMVIKPLGSEVSPVDGTALSFGELKESRGMIEQVKGHFYSVPALLGTNSLLPMDESEEESVADKGDKSWLKVSLASLKLRASQLGHPMKGLYYCVIYLIPGDYHRIHSPADWNALVRTHFAGRLFLNECATRNIKNLYVENESSYLKGYGNKVLWYLLLLVRPTLDPLKQISKRKKLFPTEPPEEQVYDPQGHGVKLEKGKEVGVFNMGSTVVLVFQEPTANSPDGSSSSSDYRFYVKLCLLMTIPRRTCWQAMLLSCSSKTYNFTPNYGTFTMSATSKDVSVKLFFFCVLRVCETHSEQHNSTRGMADCTTTCFWAVTRWMGLQKGWTLINQPNPDLEMRRRAANAPGVIVGSTTRRLSHQVFFSCIKSSTQLLFSVLLYYIPNYRH